MFQLDGNRRRFAPAATIVIIDKGKQQPKMLKIIFGSAALEIEPCQSTRMEQSPVYSFPVGLQVIGTENSEIRRIDHQIIIQVAFIDNLEDDLTIVGIRNEL